MTLPLLLIFSSFLFSSRVPRHVLNCPLFDQFLKEMGVSVAPNRHALQDIHLPVLDRLVVDDIKKRLSKVKSVSLSADGWRDRVRRDWIDAAIYFVEEKDERWTIEVVHPDLILVPCSATSEAIHTLIAETIDEFVRLFYLFFLLWSSPPHARSRARALSLSLAGS